MNRYLLDTNVVSELMKPAAERNVARWAAEARHEALYVSAVTVGELARGAAGLAPGRRKDQLMGWLEESLPKLISGIFPFDRHTALIWGDLMGRADRAGRPLAAFDAQIAATAIQHGCTVVTRDTADFEPIGVPLLNPWAAL